MQLEITVFICTIFDFVFSSSFDYTDDYNGFSSTVSNNSNNLVMILYSASRLS